MQAVSIANGYHGDTAVPMEYIGAAVADGAAGRQRFDAGDTGFELHDGFDLQLRLGARVGMVAIEQNARADHVKPARIGVVEGGGRGSAVAQLKLVWKSV